MNNERTYVDLIFRATQKYASWDPEIAVKNGTFVREGNIYLDGKADKYRIAAPVECGRESEGEVWVISHNAHRWMCLPLLADPSCRCKMHDERRIQFSSGCGAILAMENTMITIIDPPGALKYDLSMGGVVVSEVHSCSSYARVITAEAGSIIALGLRVEPTISQALHQGHCNLEDLKHSSSLSGPVAETKVLYTANEKVQECQVDRTPLDAKVTAIDGTSVVRGARVLDTEFGHRSHFRSTGLRETRRYEVDVPKPLSSSQTPTLVKAVEF
ncbi:hypothetical protein B0H13DRAFT_2329257 [Mycena leptocephala]|nr:hypothetical protein B0H13DRAFT_2329257 [Mycena leptocephala]